MFYLSISFNQLEFGSESPAPRTSSVHIFFNFEMFTKDELNLNA